MVTEVEKNRHKCLMVIKDILRRKGSDTRCVFLSGEKCLDQAGRSRWLGMQWLVWVSNDALGLWGEAGGGRGANCKKHTRAKNPDLMTHVGCQQVVKKTIPLSKIADIVSSQQSHKHIHPETGINLLSKETLSPIYNFHNTNVTECKAATPPPPPPLPIWCQCVKCQHGRMHWLTSRKNMPSSCVMVCAAAPCESETH